MKAVNRVVSVFLQAVAIRMREMGMSQTALAKRLNVSRPYVTKVLSGDVNITLGAAARFAHALQMDFIPTLTPQPAASERMLCPQVCPPTSSPCSPWPKTSSPSTSSTLLHG